MTEKEDDSGSPMATPAASASATTSEPVHGGHHAINAALAAGANTLFTLSGAHIFPLYDAAVGGSAMVQQAGSARAAERAGPLRLIDVRHEQTAVFAAEAVGKLTRSPGFAAVTAGPGVTNAISAVTGAWMNGSPLVLIGGRAPEHRWGSGALQELDHVPLLEPVTKAAWTIRDPAQIRARTAAAFDLAASAHRGPVFIDIPMDVLFTPSVAATANNHEDVQHTTRRESTPIGDVERAAHLLRSAQRPVMIIGSDTWAGGGEQAARDFVRTWQIPVIANGMGRGIVPADDPLLVTRARSAAFADADLVLVAGAPLDFRLGYGVFGKAAKSGGPAVPVIHLVDAPTQVADHAAHALAVIGDIAHSLSTLSTLAGKSGSPASSPAWLEALAAASRAAWEADAELLASAADPIHPARIYGEIRRRLNAEDVVIGDGGDFVSFAGRFIEPSTPGRWLDPGPFGCLGTGPGYALGTHVALPDAHPWLMMGDGAAGFSLMDVDSLVRHQVPVTMVVGNNSGWGLEKHPMRFLYGYDILADLEATPYDHVVRALGGAGETVTEPAEIGAALDRARGYQGPYLVNIITDPEVAYPRTTTGI